MLVIPQSKLCVYSSLGSNGGPQPPFMSFDFLGRT
jgi:hypothetical protein